MYKIVFIALERKAGWCRVKEIGLQKPGFEH